MTNLFPELSGGLAGGLGAAGGGLLGQLGGILSAPRKALWGALGLPDSGAELLHHTLGLDPESFAGQALGMGAEMLGDPLTLAGGPLTRALGGVVGKSATKAQLLKGPEYAGDLSKLAGLGAEAGSPLSRILERESPEALARLSQEIPQGSTLLGEGMHGVALKTPEGGVIRLERGGLRKGMEGAQPPLSRLDTPEVLQPHRNVTAGATRLEHLPMVDVPEDRLVSPLEKELAQWGPGVGKTPQDFETIRGLNRQVEAHQQTIADQTGKLGDSAIAKGLDPWDLHPGNLAVTSEGRLLTHDPGAIVTPFKETAGFRFAPSTDLGQQPGRVGSLFSRLLGGRGRLRDYLNQGYASGGAGQGILY